jgi:deoxyribodipyrimidine photo-lyase
MSPSSFVSVPEIRVRAANRASVRAEGAFVLYWMIAARRTRWSYALDRAVEWSERLGRPLVVLEPLRAAYPWASARLHRFVLDGMADNARRFAEAGVFYHPYVEPGDGEGRGLLETLAARAAVVVTDDFPCFVIPRMVAAAARKVPVRLELVDGNGLLPMRAAPAAATTAQAFRRLLQRELAAHVSSPPSADPLASARFARGRFRPAAIAKRWPAADRGLLEGDPSRLRALPIDHSVAPVSARGGEIEAERVLERFVVERLPHYATRRNEPGAEATSGLSPYLHFGHVSVHRILARLLEREGRTFADFAPDASAGRAGWRGLDDAGRAFVDELVTWREIGFNFCANRTDYDHYGSLPGWAIATLGEHARDPRPRVYDLDAFAAAATHDPLWNAAQTELLREGRIHGYLRMLWGKKILEWSRSPEEALAIMIELNDRLAVDGRDPNSYSGILWVLGRYDRPWPERPVFGTVRAMTSASTARKYDVSGYLRRWNPRTT